MKVEDFIKKWSRSILKESAASQTHFNDLCAVLGIAAPVEADPTGEWFAFEAKTNKDGQRIGFADVWRKHKFAWEYKGSKKDLEEALDQLRRYLPALENPPVLIVSDTKLIRLVTNFTNTAQVTLDFELEDLRIPAKVEQLRFAFEQPEKLHPGRTPQSVTLEAAAEFATIVQALRQDGHAAEDAAQFATQMLFCLFAEDIGLLKHRDFREIVEEARQDRSRFVPALSTLLKYMNEGGLFGAHRIPLFNGRLFEHHEALPLPDDAFEALWKVSALSWSEIDPAIFGTLFEWGMNPGKADLVGRHYTDPQRIRQIIRPVILNPLNNEWEAVRPQIEDLIGKALAAKRQSARTTHRNKAQRLYGGLVGRLSQITVLDPACGSGNFLYLALQEIKEFEHRIGIEAERMGLEREVPQVGPQNMCGIDIDDYGVRLARATVWIGQIQWMHKNGYGPPGEPILPPLETIECRDALVESRTGADDRIEWSEATWPSVDFIVGNPPFLGDKLMRRRLGDSYTEGVRSVFANRVPGSANLVTYWFEKARAALVAGQVNRVGLVSTSSIRNGSNRIVLQRIRETALIFDAWSDQEWEIDGAAVRVSLVCFARPSDPAAEEAFLDGKPVEQIFANLTGGRAGTRDFTQAKRLQENRGVCFQGTIKDGNFDIAGALAREWLLLPTNPNGRPNSEVVRPWMNADDITGRPSDNWIVDFGTSRTEIESAQYEQPFRHVVSAVKPFREQVRRAANRTYWWRFGETRPGMRAALAGLTRYIAIPRVAKHVVPIWLDVSVVPDSRIVVAARGDDTTFGILNSRFHRLWVLAQCSRHGVGDDPTYDHLTVFETFPFPKGITPNIDANIIKKNPRAKRIAEIAKKLDDYRFRWLNPPEWIAPVREVVSEFPDRLLPESEETAELLQNRTLTKLYNSPPEWLANLKNELDAAVAAAYGWPVELSDAEILHRLLELNLARAEEEAGRAGPEQLTIP